MDALTKDRITKTILEVMGVDVASVDRKSRLDGIPGWDSFNNLMLISKFEEDYGVEFTAVEIEATQTVEDIYSLLERKLSSRGG